MGRGGGGKGGVEGKRWAEREGVCGGGAWALAASLPTSSCGHQFIAPMRV